MNYTAYLKNFELIFDFPSEAREHLLQSLLTIIAHPTECNYLNTVIENYNISYNIDYEHNNRMIKDIAELVNIEKETVLLLVYILMSKQLKKYYVTKGYSKK